MRNIPKIQHGFTLCPRDCESPFHYVALHRRGATLRRAEL